MLPFAQREEVRLTRALVGINSTGPGALEGEIGDFVARWLAENTPAQISREPVREGRANVTARLHGASDAHKLVYICHMDTVPVGEGWTRDPFGGEIEDGRLYGRGACDMKAGLAAAMLAFRNIARRQAGLKYDFLFIATVDEEGAMAGGEQAVRDGLVNADCWVLDAEPTGGHIQAAHKGKTWFELRALGKTCHASTPQLGSDAIAAMAELIVRVRAKLAALPEHPEMGPSSATFGVIQGGWNPYIVPDTCQATLDLRLTPPLTNDASIALVDEAIAEAQAAVPGVRFHYTVTARRPPIEKDANSFLLKKLRAAAAAVGPEPPVDLFPGYTDTAVIAALTGCRNCMSYGPGSLAQAHRPDEFVPCEDITRSVAVMTRLAEDILL